MSDPLTELEARLGAATGSDRQLDELLSRELDGAQLAAAPDFTGSVDRSLELIRRVLPGWSWHVGWNATGVLPYASLHRGERLVEAQAPTVPLALLRALLRAHRETLASR